MCLESFNKHTETTLGLPPILPNSHWLLLLARYDHWVEFNNAVALTSLLMQRVPTGSLQRGYSVTKPSRRAANALDIDTLHRRARQEQQVNLVMSASILVTPPASSE
jgi:hypothetical protein